MECKSCGARAPFVSISATGLCPDHSRIRLTDNLRALATRSGPNWHKWRKGMARAAGFVVMDERGDEG